MSLISSLNIAQQALAVNQTAITIISNNIANVDNENYSKLRANLSDVVTNSSTQGAEAEANGLKGVQVSKIERYSNAYLQSYYWTQNSTANYYDKSYSVATSVQSLMNELNDTGLSNALSSFYSAVTALNKAPTDYSARQNFVSTAQNVCSVLNNYYSSLTSIQNSLVGDYAIAGDVQNSQIAGQVTEVNDLIDQLASVNKNIVSANASGVNSTSLLDQRDAIITKLTTYSNINVAMNNNGSASVSVGNTALLQGSNIMGKLEVATGNKNNPAEINFVANDGKTTNLNSSITGGSIGAILDICGTDSANFTISSAVDQLDTLAAGFAGILNDLQTKPTTDADGNTTYPMGLKNTAGVLSLISTAGEPLFVSSIASETTISAKNISVNKDLINDPYLVAAARVAGTVGGGGAVTPTDATATGNNSNTTAITTARTTKNLNGQTVEGYLSSIASKVGYSVDSIKSNDATQSTVLKNIKSQLQSETGVNLDEELSDLIKFQRAYEASARVFSTCNDLLQQLIQLGK